MKTMTVVLMLMVGCADGGAGSPDAAGGATGTGGAGGSSMDASVDAADSGPGDACVMAHGNCGCVWYDDYDSATGTTVSRVVCPDAG